MRLNRLLLLLASLLLAASSVTRAAPGWPALPDDDAILAAARGYCETNSQTMTLPSMPGSPPDGSYARTVFSPSRIVKLHNPGVADPVQASEAFVLVRDVSEEVRPERTSRHEWWRVVRLVLDESGSGYTVAEVSGWETLPDDAQLQAFLASYLNSYYSQTLYDEYTTGDRWLPGFAGARKARYQVTVDAPLPSRPLDFVIRVVDPQADPGSRYDLVAGREVTVHVNDRPGNRRKMADYCKVRDALHEAGDDVRIGDAGTVVLTTDGKGEARLGLFLDYGKLLGGEAGSDVHLPTAGNPVEVSLEAVFGYTDEAGREVVLGRKEKSVSIDYIARVLGIYVQEPAYYPSGASDAVKNPAQPIRRYRDVRPPAASSYRLGPDRVKVFSSKTPLAYTSGLTQEVNARIDWQSQRTLNADDPVRLNDVINIYAGQLSADGIPWQSLQAGGRFWKGWMSYDLGYVGLDLAFLDGTVGRIRMAPTLTDVHAHGSVVFGETAAGSGFATQEVKVATFLVSAGAKVAINYACPPLMVFTATHTLYSVLMYTFSNKPQQVLLHSAVLFEEDPDHERLLVTTREGRATLFNAATGPEGVAIPAGKTADVPVEGRPVVRDTDPGLAKDADSVLEVPPPGVRRTLPPTSGAPPSRTPPVVASPPTAQPPASDPKAELEQAKREYEEAFEVYTRLVTTGGDGDLVVAALERYRKAYARYQQLLAAERK